MLRLLSLRLDAAHCQSKALERKNLLITVALEATVKNIHYQQLSISIAILETRPGLAKLGGIGLQRHVVNHRLLM
jgi:hypothetical protein